MVPIITSTHNINMQPNILKKFSFLIVGLLMVVAGLAQGPCPRGPLVRIPITSLTKSPSPGMMVITDSCLNQMYVFPDSVTTGGDVTNQYFAGDTLVTILANGDTLISISNAITGVNYDNDTLCIYTSQGDTFCTVIAIDGDTSGTGRVRLLDNLGVEDTLMTNAAPAAPDNLTLTNAVRLEVPNTIKWGGDLVDATTTIHSPDSSHNITYQDINLERHYGASHRFYPWSSFILDGGVNAYFQMSSRTSFYIRADTVLQLDLYQHGLSDSSHLLIRTDRLRKAIAKPGAFMQLLSDTPGTYQGDSDWSKYQFPLAAPADTGNYVLNFDGDEFTFQEAPNPSVGGSGTLNYVVKWTPDGNTLGNSQIYDDGTNVGIGTTSSLAKLMVETSGTLSSDTAFYVKNGTLAESHLLTVLGDGQVYINSNTGSDLTNIGTSTGPVVFNRGYNNTFRYNQLTFYGTNISSGIQGFSSDPGIAIGYAQTTINPNTGSPFSVKAKSATAASPVQVWDNNAGTDLAIMREDGLLNFKYTAGGIIFDGNQGKGVFYNAGSSTTIYSNFTAHLFRVWNGSTYAQRAYLDNTGLLIGSSGTAVRDFHTAGTARITASVDTATVAHFWMGNTLGDLRKVNIGSNFTVQGDSLKVNINGVTGSGVLNYLSRWAPDGTQLTIGVTRDDSTAVGMGSGPVDSVRLTVQSRDNLSTSFAGRYKSINGNNLLQIRSDGSVWSAGPGDDATNTIFGLNAGSNASYGSTIFGANAGLETTGFANTVVGSSALRWGTSVGVSNVAVGHGSLNNGGSRSRNTGVGYESLFSASSNDNTAHGSQALRYLTSAGSNTAIGSQALKSLNVGGGTFNTALGMEAGINAQTQGTTFVGAGSGYNSTADHSIFLGRNAGFSVTKDSTFLVDVSSDTVAMLVGDLGRNRIGINRNIWAVKRNLDVNGDARIVSDVDTATLARLWAGNTEGDLRRVKLGPNLTFDGDTLNTAANQSLFEYPHGSSPYTDAEFPRSKTLTAGQTDTVRFAVAGPGDVFPGSQFDYRTDGRFLAEWDTAYIDKYGCTPCKPRYEMQFNASLSIASPDTIAAIRLKVYLNGVEQAHCAQETWVAANNRPVNISTTCHLKMLDGDYVDLRLQNAQADSRTFTIRRLTANMHQVGFSYWEPQ